MNTVESSAVLLAPEQESCGGQQDGEDKAKSRKSCLSRASLSNSIIDLSEMSASGRPTLAVLKRRFEDLTPPFSSDLFAELASDPRAGAAALLKSLQRRQYSWQAERKRLERLSRWERGCRKDGFDRVAGVDEVGRGPLAGPIVAAAVVFPPDPDVEGVDDSKKLSPAQRERLYREILKKALDVGLGVVGSRAIDRLGIQKANLLAMTRAVNSLCSPPDILLVDALILRTTNDIPQKSIIGGDSASISIAAASIVAKVTRDRIMVLADQKYPQYAFAQHKGYGTSRHLEAIARHGLCRIHRRSFAPLKGRA